MIIEANEKIKFDTLNNIIRNSDDNEIIVNGCIGQRYIGAGTKKSITINGTAGNASGAYLNGGKLLINGNAQDAIGDTMNDGEIIVNGTSGDALGYAMRGGKIFIKGSVGYRAGIHMKAYESQKPVIVIGGTAGNFLGEYLAGGIIIVLGLNSENKSIVGNFCGTGMYDGAIYLCTEKLPYDFPQQVDVKVCDNKDMTEISDNIKEYIKIFNINNIDILSKKFYKITANTENKYKQLYASN